MNSKLSKKNFQQLNGQPTYRKMINSTNLARASPQSLAPSQITLSLEKELGMILKRFKYEPSLANNNSLKPLLPDAPVLERIHAIITHCKTAAHKLALFLLTSQFKSIKRWFMGGDRKERSLIIQIITTLLDVACTDYASPTTASSIEASG
jgi:hypothetical protein